jgi:hypothetical protein
LALKILRNTGKTRLSQQKIDKGLSVSFLIRLKLFLQKSLTQLTTTRAVGRRQLPVLFLTIYEGAGLQTGIAPHPRPGGGLVRGLQTQSHKQWVR